MTEECQDKLSIYLGDGKTLDIFCSRALNQTKRRTRKMFCPHCGGVIKPNTHTWYCKKCDRLYEIIEHRHGQTLRLNANAHEFNPLPYAEHIAEMGSVQSHDSQLPPKGDNLSR